MIAEQFLRSLSVHETGHFLVSTHFDIPARVWLEVDEDGTPRSGFCCREFAGDPFKAGCVGWAGVLAEHLLGCVDPLRTPIPWNLLADFDAWEMTASSLLHELSETDRQHIIGYFDSQRTSRFAFRILQNGRERLDRLARELADRTRPEMEAKAEAFARAQLEQEEYNRPEAVEQRAIAYAALTLERFLSTLPPDHHARPMHEAALGFLSAGKRPPNNVFEKQELQQ